MTTPLPVRSRFLTVFGMTTPSPGTIAIPRCARDDRGMLTPRRLMFRTISIIAFVFAATTLGAQQPANAGTEGDFEMRGFKFNDGSTLPVLRIHYTTLGHPKKDARGVVRNAVLILHGTTGSGRGFLSRT